MSDAPAQRPLDVRVGSATNGLAPVSISDRPLGAGPRQWLGLGAIVVAAVLADQFTKYLVTSDLALDDSVKVVGPFSIHRVENSGIAFGLFPGATEVVSVLTAVAVVWMLVVFTRSGARHPILPAALGLLIGGSLSNFIDRVRLGHVTDFLDLRHWPAFNLADSFICISVVVLLVAAFGAETRSSQTRRVSPARPQ